MPVVVASASRSADALISYALDDKPNQIGERFVMASGVGGLLVSVAKQQMRDVRKKWNKDKPKAFVHAYHVIESFAKDELNPDDPDSWMTAQTLGRALAEDRFPGRQALVVTQRDGKTGCVHNHIVVNSIETKTGRSLDSSIVMHARLVEAHERVLEAEGFEQRADLKQAFADASDRRERGEPSGLRRGDSTQRSELREFQRHILWETENDIADEFGGAHKPEPFSTTILKAYIDNALADPMATDWASFVDAGRRHGVRIEQRGRKGRGISYGMLREQPDGTLAEPSASDRRRCSTLGTAFEMDAVDQALARNRAAHQAPASVAPVVAPVSHLSLATLHGKPAQKAPSFEERLLSAVSDVGEQANANTRRMIADYLTTKASNAEPPKPSEASTQPQPNANLPVPGDASSYDLQHLEPAQEPAPAAPVSPDELEAAEAIWDPQVSEGDTAALCKINERNRRINLPSVSPEQDAANQAMTPTQRKRMLKHPELFEDSEPDATPAEHGRAFGD